VMVLYVISRLGRRVHNYGSFSFNHLLMISSDEKALPEEDKMSIPLVLHDSEPANMLMTLTESSSWAKAKTSKLDKHQPICLLRSPQMSMKLHAPTPVLVQLMLKLHMLPFQSRQMLMKFHVTIPTLTIVRHMLKFDVLP
jgi:hypothetical protein